MSASRPLVHYQQVAEVYEEAREEGEATALAISMTWQVPESTSVRWIRRARSLGLLAPSRKRVPCCCLCHDAAEGVTLP